MSHLLQMRGLKHRCSYELICNSMSHLLQMRGLKLDRTEYTFTLQVASFTDAWIETLNNLSLKYGNKSHLLQMRGLKLPGGLHFVAFMCRIFYRCVD